MRFNLLTTLLVVIILGLAIKMGFGAMALSDPFKVYVGSRKSDHRRRRKNSFANVLDELIGHAPVLEAKNEALLIENVFCMYTCI